VILARRLTSDEPGAYIPVNKQGAERTEGRPPRPPGGGTANESVDLIRPADGNYQIWLHGFQVSGTPSITLRVHAIQGNDLSVTDPPSGPVAAGTPVTLHVAFSKPMTAGQDVSSCSAPRAPRSRSPSP
jgi:hypothetical protein